MKKTNKKGFTIVELVIVIAVIAILSAVLIPTFGSIIESANRAVDTQLVAQINTILAIEDVLGGGVNDAVEIQKIVEENGLKLETKSKGALILYDKKNNRAVLGTLDESGEGIIIKNTASGTGSNVAKSNDGPALMAAVVDNSVADNNDNSASTKVSFRSNITKLEQIFDYYLMITTKSRDGLAEAICGLRNADSADKITEELAKITEISTKLGANLTEYMNKTVVVTKNGDLISNSNNTDAKYVLVNSELPEVTANLITALNEYPNVDLVEFHSNITSFGEGALDAMKDNGTTYIYNNDSGANKTADNIYHISDRGDVVKTLLLKQNIDGGSYSDAGELGEINLMTGSIIDLPYRYLSSTDATKAYKFKGYSFSADGDLIPYGVENYELSEYEKNCAVNGTLYIYAQYETKTPTFKMGNNYYENAGMTYLLSKGSVSGTVTVVSTNSKLDASLIGKSKAELTIPSGVELLLPYADDFAKKEWTITAGTFSKDKYNAGGDYDKATMTGKTNLSIASNVTLNIASGASLYVDAACYNASTSYQCFITNNAGVVELDGSIVSAGNITAYGIIRGNGTITANGGAVTELMTLYDWYGGTNATNAVGKKVTPFNNWKIEHIAVSKMTVNHPTQYKTQSGITYTVPVVGTVVSVPIDGFTLAGPSTSSPLFITTDGTAIERSVSSNGNMKFTIAKGNVVDSAKTLNFKASAFGSINVNFTEMSLPISNMDIVVAKDANLTVSNNIYKIMPGSSITVDKGAVLNIGTEIVVCNSFDLQFEAKANRVSGSYTWVYDIDDTGAKMTITKYYKYGDANKEAVRATATIYSPPHRLPYSDTPAKLVVNGTLNFDGGAFAGNITSTQSGATINVNSDIGGYEIPEGYYIQNSAHETWFDVHVPSQHSATVLAGINGGKAGTLEAGTYKFVSYETSEGSVNMWQKQ